MPLDTVVCVDTSGSMAGRGMRELKKACKDMLNDVRCTARDTKLRENLALVEFGNKVRVACPLTDNYDRFERAVDSLEPGGRTPMKEGLMLALAEILKNGGVLRLGVRGSTVLLAPRVILMTDGMPTDKDGETETARQAVLELAKLFGPGGYREADLPHAVPVSCFCCGDSIPDLLQNIAQTTNGAFAGGDVSDLSAFFRRQVLLTRFVIECANDMEQLRSRRALEVFMRQVGEAIEQVELDGLLRLLMALLVVEGGGRQRSLSAGLQQSIVRDLPPFGSRVRRGPDWRWNDQDSGGCGTVVGHQPPGVVRVQWDNDSVNIYRYGAEGGKHDVRVVDEPRVLRLDERVKPGVSVVRSCDWRDGDSDGGAGNEGVVYKVADHDGGKKVWVRWKVSGNQAAYTLGDGSRGEVKLQVRPVPRPRILTSTSRPQAPLAQSGDGAAAQIGIEGSATVDELTGDDFLGLGVGKYSWQWQAKDESWYLFADCQTVYLERNYRPDGSAVLTTEGVEWKVDFDAMVMRRLSRDGSGPTRAVRRAALSNRDRDLAEALTRSLVMK